MRIGSICSGYGGLDTAVAEIFGAEVAWFFEYDKAPSKILAHHWPEIPNYGDVTTADWAAIEQVEIICGGTPCQDLSGAGKRAGMTEGTRSNLWVAMREAIAIQQPRFVVWENVRGAYSASASSEVESEPGLLGGTPGGYLRALGRVVGDLASLGYDSKWVGVRAADVGAPHGRYRVFLVAEHTGHGSGGTELWDEREPNYGVGQSGQSPANTESDRRARARAPRYRRAGSENSGGGTSVADPGSDEPERRGISGNVGGPSSSGESDREQRQRIRHTTSDSSTEATPNPDHPGRREYGGGITVQPEQPSVEHSGADTWGDYRPAIERWETVLGRTAPPPTLPDGKNGNHRLNSAFVEWMMGLPEGHVTNSEIGLTRNEQLKALGNGVVPAQAMYALRLLLETP